MIERLSLPLAVLGVLAMLFLVARVCFAATGVEYALAQALHPKTTPSSLSWRDVASRLFFRAMSGVWLSPDEVVVMRAAHPDWGLTLSAADAAAHPSAPAVPAFEAVGLHLDPTWLPMPTHSTLSYVQAETAYLCARLRPTKTVDELEAIPGLEAASRMRFEALDEEVVVASNRDA